MGGVDFAGLFANLGGGEYSTIAAAEEAGAAVFAYGRFIMAIINFLIIAFVVFMLVRNVNKLKEAAKKEEEAVAPAPSKSCSTGPRASPKQRPSRRPPAGF